MNAGINRMNYFIQTEMPFQNNHKTTHTSLMNMTLIEVIYTTKSGYLI